MPEAFRNKAKTGAPVLQIPSVYAVETHRTAEFPDDHLNRVCTDGQWDPSRNRIILFEDSWSASSKASGAKTNPSI